MMALFSAADNLAKLAQRLNRRAGGGCQLPLLLLLTDRHRLPDPLAAAQGLPRGSAVILRDYDDPQRAALARRLHKVCRARDLRLLIGGDWRLAAQLGADGVHLPEAQIDQRSLRRRPPRMLLTMAAHGVAALYRAHRAGADAVLLSPAFASASHPGAPGLGPIRFAAIARQAPLPVYALGGVTGRNAGRLAASGIVGIAAISALSR